MTPAFLVAQREYLENIQTKGFWIGIFMLPVMLLMFAIVPFIVESTREAKRYAVIDESGWLLAVVQHQIEAEDLAEVLRAISGSSQRAISGSSKKALSGSVQRAISGSPAKVDTSLPTAFLEFNLILSRLDDQQLVAIAAGILGTKELLPRLVHLPDAAESYLSQYGTQMADWWSSRSLASRAEFSPGISTNHFIFQDEKKSMALLNQMIQENKLFAYFVIGPDPVKGNSGSRYVSNNLTDRDLLNWFGGFVTRQVRAMRLERENLDPDIATWINEPLTFEELKLSVDGTEEPVATQDIARQWAPVVFVYLLWISILINTQMLLTSTIEEKSNKLIEVLLSSVSPITLMAGKILGIAATGLTIITAWTLIAFSFFILLPAAVGINPTVDVSSVISDPWFMASFLVYFILGYLLYAAILVGLGSLCNNLKDAQNLMLPVQLVQMIPIFVMVPIARDPNGTLAQMLSYFPPLTPFVMMNRAAAPPTTTEYIITTILLLVSIAAALWFAAKLFRIGILLTGKPPAMREIVRWLRAPATNT